MKRPLNAKLLAECMMWLGLGTVIFGIITHDDHTITQGFVIFVMGEVWDIRAKLP
jgi:hypothetical protein